MLYNLLNQVITSINKTKDFFGEMDIFHFHHNGNHWPHIHVKNSDNFAFVRDWVVQDIIYSNLCLCAIYNHGFRQKLASGLKILGSSCILVNKV